MKIELSVSTIGLPKIEDIQKAIDDLENKGLTVVGICEFEFKDAVQSVCYSKLTVEAI